VPIEISETRKNERMLKRIHIDLCIEITSEGADTSIDEEEQVK
jgi:hypothetical protein